MSLDFYPAQAGRFTNGFNNFTTVVKADETADDLSDMCSFSQDSAAKLVPLLGLPIDEDGYGEIAAADLYQRCHAVLQGDRAVIEEFTCAKDARFEQILTELATGLSAGSQGPRVINMSDAHTVEGLRRRVLHLQELALLTMQRHGSQGWIQMC